ncbi:hypothetical protein HK405_001575 [Cladochytrium tenue]|nr:hypothetical protein HK405_001575 [Cladochytrium tenue]
MTSQSPATVAAPNGNSSSSTRTSNATSSSNLWGSNLWGRLPRELHDRVLGYASPLTRHLNGRLTPAETWAAARDVWGEALASGWDGDLALLPHPAWAVPTAQTGLCAVRSRTVYERLKILRPDLADPTTLLVWLHNDEGYGHFEPGIHANLVVYVDDADYDAGAEVAAAGFSRRLRLEGHSWDSGTRDNAKKVLARSLMHVAMRNCWLDELEPFVRINRERLGFLAILFGHTDLLAALAAPDAGFDPATALYPGLHPCRFAVEHDDFALFRAMQTRREGICPSGLRDRCLAYKNLPILIARERLEFLKQLHEHYPARFLAACGEGEVDPGTTTVACGMDVWEWMCDLLQDDTGVRHVLPLPRTAAEARRLVVRMPVVHPEVLRRVANTCDPDVFDILWVHRPATAEWPTLSNLSETSSRAVQASFVDLAPGSNPSMIALKHKLGHACPRYLLLALPSAPLETLKAFHEHCRCPGFDWRSEVVTAAALQDDLHVVLWAVRQLGQPTQAQVNSAFLRACSHGALSVAHFLIEEFAVDTPTLWWALVQTCDNGTPGVARFVWAQLRARGATSGGGGGGDGGGDGGEQVSNPLELVRGAFNGALRSGRDEMVRLLLDEVGIGRALAARDVGLAVQRGRSLRVARLLCARMQSFVCPISALHAWLFAEGRPGADGPGSRLPLFWFLVAQARFVDDGDDDAAAAAAVAASTTDPAGGPGATGHADVEVGVGAAEALRDIVGVLPSDNLFYYPVQRVLESVEHNSRFDSGSS